MRILVLLLVLAYCDCSSACSPRRIPETLSAGEYRAVLVAEVTGVRLTDYEEYKAGKTDLLPDSGGAFVVNAWVERVLDGHADSMIEVRLEGCLQATPSLHERGIFLVAADGAVSQAVWESNPVQYSNLVNAAERIGSGR